MGWGGEAAGSLLAFSRVSVCTKQSASALQPETVIHLILTWTLAFFSWLTDNLIWSLKGWNSYLLFRNIKHSPGGRHSPLKWEMHQCFIKERNEEAFLSCLSLPAPRCAPVQADLLANVAWLPASLLHLKCFPYLALLWTAVNTSLLSFTSSGLCCNIAKWG